MLDEVLLQGGGKRHTPSVALFHTPALRGLLKRWARPQRGIGPFRETLASNSFEGCPQHSSSICWPHTGSQQALHAWCKGKPPLRAPVAKPAAQLSRARSHVWGAIQEWCITASQLPQLPLM